MEYGEWPTVLTQAEGEALKIHGSSVGVEQEPFRDYGERKESQWLAGKYQKGGEAVTGSEENIYDRVTRVCFKNKNADAEGGSLASLEAIEVEPEDEWAKRVGDAVGEAVQELMKPDQVFDEARLDKMFPGLPRMRVLIRKGNLDKVAQSRTEEAIKYIYGEYFTKFMETYFQEKMPKITALKKIEAGGLLMAGGG